MLTYLLCGGLYAIAMLAAARVLFSHWRPHRAVACGQRARRSSVGYDGFDPGHQHSSWCYRRRRTDLTAWPFDYDPEAFAAALGVSLLWPLALLYLAVTARPHPTLPEREAQLAARRRSLEKAEKEAAEAQRELDKLNAATELRRRGKP